MNMLPPASPHGPDGPEPGESPGPRKGDSEPTPAPDRTVDPHATLPGGWSDWSPPSVPPGGGQAGSGAEPVWPMRRYEILGRIGGGGMGEVMRAWDHLLHRVVALKFIGSGLRDLPEAIRWFLGEARAAARLSHPNIVTIYDVYDDEEAGGRPFLAMEFVEGTDLASLVRERGPLPVWEAREYIRMAATGLQHAHEKGLVHRDIKPSNLMRTTVGSAIKILDLGVAMILPRGLDEGRPGSEPQGPADPRAGVGPLHRRRDTEGGIPEGEGVVKGTPGFMSPESWESSRVDIRSDIYSLGCTFYHLLTGRAPFQGSPKALRDCHLHREPQPLEELNPDVPRNLAAVVRKMMAKRPEDRYQTPAEVAAALARLTQPPPPPRPGVPETPEALVAALRQFQILDAGQLDEIELEWLPRSPDLRPLVLELAGRGWLTDYQCDELLKGRGQDLALGSYILLAPIGAGAFGRVFRARPRLQTGRMVAIKVIRSELVSDPDAVARFRREIIASTRLSHANIVLVLAADEIDGKLFYVMEYLEGRDLSQAIRDRSPLPIPEVCDWVSQAARGLHHIHESGMVHRDIKPSNLFLRDGDGAIKILDLGLVRLILGAESRKQSFHDVTKSGIGLGTPDYMAPEQAQEGKAADIRSDLYSLGCTLYQFLTSQVPFPAPNPFQTILGHLSRTPTPVEELRPDVPPPVAAVVRKLMAKDPADRHQSPSELLDDLARLDRSA